MLSSLRDDLLLADLSLEGSAVRREADRLTVTSRASLKRSALACLFLAPAAIFAWSAWQGSGPWLFALLACPLLTVVGTAFAVMRFEKSFERAGRRVTSSLRFLGLRALQMSNAPDDAAVRLESDWEFDPLSWDYGIEVDGVSHGALSTREYEKGLEMARQLAEVLELELVDETSMKSRGAG